MILTNVALICNLELSNRFVDVMGSNNERKHQSGRDEPHAEAQASIDLDYGGCARPEREKEKETKRKRGRFLSSSSRDRTVSTYLPT